MGNISITDIDGNFLSELVDFVNTTVSRDISLFVPKKGAFPNWNGLEPNAKYVIFKTFSYELLEECRKSNSFDLGQ